MGTFEEVYRQHIQSVFRFALSVVGRKELAEDLTSEAFLALWRNFDDIDQGQLPGWLIAVVRNRARDWWRRQQVEQRHVTQEMNLAKPAAPPLEHWILDSPDLKPVHRTCMMLRYVHGMTRAEIADRLALSETQVKGYLQYALSLLRKSLRKDDRRMKTTANDWDRDERETLQPLQDELQALQDRHASDPPFDQLRAADSDALPSDLQASIAQHLADDRWSRVLVEGANTGSGALSPDDEGRLLDRIRRSAAPRSGWRALRPRVWVPLLAGAAAAVMAVAIVQRSREAPVPPPGNVTTTAPAAAPAPTVAPFHLSIDKPDVKLSPRALTYRGDVGGGDFVLQLKPALDAYREGDYARADREFTVLATRYPQAVEVHFYQGIARLFLNDLSGADASLSAADRTADASFAADVAWYRAIVDERLGHGADARARLTALCSQSNHARQAAACEAANKLR